MHVGDTMSTPGDVQYIGQTFCMLEGYHDGHGEKVDKSLLISIQNPDVLSITQCTHDIPQCT